MFQSGLVRSSRLLPVALGLIGGLVGGMLFVLVASMGGEPGLLTRHSVQVVAVAALYDALVAPVLFPVLRWASGDRDRDQWRYR